MPNKIPIEVKKECVDLRKSGKPIREIYNEYFKHQFSSPESFESFRRAIIRWSKRDYPDETTLNRGTYEGFTAHDATVQVDSDGKVVQAWIKQRADEINFDEFFEGLRSSVEPYDYSGICEEQSTDMLEVPLFDMHWGIAYMDHYKHLLDSILDLLSKQKWGRVIIPFGQDFFHSDSIEKGITSNGTVIEKVDMIRAVKDAKQFMYAIIDTAIQNGSKVEVIYTPGNHDRSMSWMFIELLLERYGPDVVDDSFEYRKCVNHGNVSVMFTHGDSKKASSQNLASIFAVTFPNEFAKATIREVHAGHLHRESESDIYGVMVRRLSSGNITDEWSDKEDYVGSHKRFMLFHWDLTKLRAIHYIC